MLNSLLRDVKFAFRQFAGRPGYTATVILVLALGLGANTAIFSVVNTFLLQPPPYPEANRIVTLAERTRGKGGDENMGLSPGNFLDWRKQATTVEHLAAFTTGPFNLSSDRHAFEAERVQGCLCAGDFLRTLGVRPVLGRPFRAEEDRFGAARAALISYNLWQHRLGGAPDVVGKSIRLDGDLHQIAGVMPAGFHFPDTSVEVWVPLLTLLPLDLEERRDLHMLSAIGRLRAGVSLTQARAELDGMAARYKRAHPDVAMGDGVGMATLHEALAQDVHTSLLILLGAVACVLLIACVNVANLLLTRASARVRELSVRTAIGASRGEIMRQLLTESALLSLAGGAAGLLVASYLAPVLLAHAPGAISVVSAAEFSLPPAVFLFAFAISLVTGMGTGLFPAWQASRINVSVGLRESTRSSTAGRSHTRFRDSLIVAEVALSLMLLMAAGLLLRSLMRLWDVRPGFRADHVLTMSFSLPNTYKGAAANAAFFKDVSRRLAGVPGVREVGLGSCPPVTGYCNTLFFYREGRPFVQGQFLVAREFTIDPNYLAAAGVPLLRGRNLTERDGIGFDSKHPRPGTLLINESMAREFFGREDPIGKRIFFDYDLQHNKQTGDPVPRYEVVGVVGDVVASLDSKPQPAMYRPLLDGGYGGGTIYLHTEGPPERMANAALHEIHRLDASLAVYDVRTVEEALGRSAADREFTMLLFGAFAGLAVLLAGIGIYGVLSYTVTQRTGEIGVRMALGASGSDVSRFILREGMRPGLAGVAIGLLAALFACRALKSMLFGVAPLDPVTFAVAPVLLLAIAAVACYVPAMRAARTDPSVALRRE